jgi:hypothetical protein
VAVGKNIEVPLCMASLWAKHRFFYKYNNNNSIDRKAKTAKQKMQQ